MKTKVKSAMISAFKLERNQMQNSFLVKDRCTIDWSTFLSTFFEVFKQTRSNNAVIYVVKDKLVRSYDFPHFPWYLNKYQKSPFDFIPIYSFFLHMDLDYNLK